MNHTFALASVAALAALTAACSAGSSADDSTALGEGALASGQKVVCTPVEAREADVDDRGDLYRVQKITFTALQDDSVELKVDRKTTDGDAMEPLLETTPSFVHTDRTLRASAKRNVLLKAGKTQNSDPRYIGFATVRDHTFAVECEVSQPRVRACRSGDTRPDVDGCNTCSCSGGRWACTELFCGPPRRPGGRGSVCTEGQTRPAGDGCNTCACNGGQWGGCTELACAPRPQRPRAQGCTEGETMSLDGCNTCTCNGGHFACTEMFCAPR
ncbi:MAG: hypothetical protein IPG50_18185 [Myxococcales bacterium]|nr:hypothetical protein [Myxococcales bacterium]